MSKKILSLILVVVMLLAMVSPAAAFTYPIVPSIPGPLNFLNYDPDSSIYNFDSTTPGPKTFIIRPDISESTYITFDVHAGTGTGSVSNAVLRKDGGLGSVFVGTITMSVDPGTDLFLTLDYEVGSVIYIDIYDSFSEDIPMIETHGFRARFNSTGATTGSPPDQTSVVPFIDMPGPNTMVRFGYDFAGWRLKDDPGSWEMYTEGQNVLASDLGYFSVEFSPVWTPTVVQKNIVFNSGAATSGTVPDSISCDPDTSITLPAADSYNLFKSGHAHRGWSLSADGTTKDFELGQTLVWASDRPDDVTLYPYMAPAATVNYTSSAGGGVLSTDSGVFVGDTYTTKASGSFTKGGNSYTRYEVNAPSGI